MDRMEWKKLLCTDRLNKVTTEDALGLTQFERDYHTIITSSHFRRLQKKTQVYVLDENDFSRTRLTHSLEVSSIAEILGKKIGQRIIEKKRSEELPDTFVDDLAMVLRCAGLLHDIGNPPFGHSGEEYIRKYFEEKEDELRRKAGYELTDQMWNDLINFEGNAHNIRIVTRLGKPSDPAASDHYGMNLTVAVIGSLIKYPYNSLEYNNREPDENGNKKHGKIGYYHSEDWIIDNELWEKSVFSKIGMEKYHKNPIMLLMEAADDIAYATADTEDAFKKGLFDKDKVEEKLKEIYENEKRPSQNENFKSRGENILYDLNCLREKAINDVVDFYVKPKNYKKIMEGNWEEDLIKGHTKGISELKEFVSEIFYKRDLDAEARYNPKKKICDILDCLIEVLTKELTESPLSFSEYIIRNEMEQYIIKGEAAVTHLKRRKEEFDKNEELYYKYMTAVDFVSCMTDSYVSIFWENINSTEYYTEKKREYKEKCLKELLSAGEIEDAGERNRSIGDILEKMVRVDFRKAENINDDNSGSNSGSSKEKRFIKDLCDVYWESYELLLIIRFCMDNLIIEESGEEENSQNKEYILKLYEELKKTKADNMLKEEEKEELKEKFGIGR